MNPIDISNYKFYNTMVTVNDNTLENHNNVKYERYYGQPISPLILHKANNHKNYYNITDYVCVYGFTLKNISNCNFKDYIVGMTVNSHESNSQRIFERFPNLYFILYVPGCCQYIVFNENLFFDKLSHFKSIDDLVLIIRNRSKNIKKHNNK